MSRVGRAVEDICPLIPKVSSLLTGSWFPANSLQSRRARVSAGLQTGIKQTADMRTYCMYVEKSCW